MFKKLFTLLIKFKIGFIILMLLIIATMFLSKENQAAVPSPASPDIIGLRVIPNPEHWSAMRWYREQKFTGSPQPLTVDGYEAVRDGRTVYVNVANIDNNNNYYTNINIISYNQSAESATTDIFGQILARWKFNTNITDENIKSEIIKDTAILARLADIKTALENYKNKNGFYPKLSSGSYLANKTISTWPSWQSALGKELGITLPIDPVNKLGACSGFNETTCWDEQSKKFASSSNNSFKLPADSHAFVYDVLPNGSIYNLCAIMSSGYVNSFSAEACEGSSLTPPDNINNVNRPPVINCDNLIGVNGKEFVGYINGYDPDGDYLSWRLSPQNTPWRNWASSTAPLSWGPASIRNYQRVYSNKAGDKGDYFVKATISDTKGNTASTTCKITIGGYCGDGVWDDIAGGSEECDINDNVATTSAESSRTKQYNCSDNCKATGGWCGDNSLQNTKEKCDGAANIALTPTESNINKQYGCTNVCGWKDGYCGDNEIQSNHEECDNQVGLSDWRCVGLGDLLCQSCQRKCSETEGILAQCGTGTARLFGVIKDDVLLTKKVFNALIEVKDFGGKLIASTTTDVNGRYDFLNLQKSFCQPPCGTNTLCGYKMTVSKTGYLKKEVDLFAFEQALEKNLFLTPEPLREGTQIKLTWGANSIDLDAHLKFEVQDETIDICYGDIGIYNGASLNESAITETITINPFVAGSIYKYYVHNYSGTSISQLPVVQIINASSVVLYEFSPESSFNEYWYIFDFNVDTGKLILKNGLNGELSMEEPE